MSTWQPAQPPGPNLSADVKDRLADMDDTTRSAKADLTEYWLARCREHLGRPRTGKPTRRIVCPACLIEVDIPDD